MRVASFFAGIGGFDLGLKKAGMKTVFLCEKNDFCQKVLRKRFPTVPLRGDISGISNEDAEDIPGAEVWCGGFPCQDVSLANQGKRLGLQGARSGLFFEFARLVDIAKPEWIILENVPGLFNSNDGDDFRAVLDELDALGYGVSWRVLDAKYFGTPQRRRRVYLVGSYGSLRSAQVLFGPGSGAVPSGSGEGQEQALTAEAGGGSPSSHLYTFQHAGIGRKATAGPQGKGYRNDGEAYTLDSRGSADAVCKTVDAFRVRDVTGLPHGMDGPRVRRTEGVEKSPDGSRYRTLGNAVAVPVIEWIGRRIIAVQNNYGNFLSPTQPPGEGV